MNRHGEAPPPDWSLSDLSEEDCERLAGEVDAVALVAAQKGQYERATDLAVAARIVREWAEQRPSNFPAP